MSEDSGGVGGVGGSGVGGGSEGGVGGSGSAGASGGVGGGDNESSSGMGASGSEPSDSDKNDFGEAMGGFGGLGIGNPGSYGGEQSVGAPGFDGGYSSDNKNEESSLNDLFCGPCKEKAPKDKVDEKLEQRGKQLEKGVEVAKEAQKHGSITQGHMKGSLGRKIEKERTQAYDLINNPQRNSRANAAMDYLSDIVFSATRTDKVFSTVENIKELIDSERVEE